MATKKETHTDRPKAPVEPHITSEARKDKVGGRKFLLGEDWVMLGQMDILREGGKFVESNNGWFTPYTKEGKRLHFMVDEKVISGIKTTKA